MNIEKSKDDGDSKKMWHIYQLHHAVHLTTSERL